MEGNVLARESCLRQCGNQQKPARDDCFKSTDSHVIFSFSHPQPTFDDASKRQMMCCGRWVLQRPSPRFFSSRGLHRGSRQQHSGTRSLADRHNNPIGGGVHAFNWKCPNAETVRKLCQQGQLTETVEALGVLALTGCQLSTALICMVLKECGAKRDLSLGRRVHALTVKKRYESNTFLCNHILRMYAHNARLQEAMDAFDMVLKPDAFTWAAIISAHVRHGQDRQARQLYHRMRKTSLKPNGHVFVAALQACVRGGDLECGQQVHADVLITDAEPDLFVCSSLVDMYAKCGSLDDAQSVFYGLAQKDVVTWNVMIAAYAQQDRGQEALRLYSAMQEEGIVAPDSVTFVSLLQACASLGIRALEKGTHLYAQIKERGLHDDVFVANSLVNMYAKCGTLKDARGLFDGLLQKDVVTWNAMIAGYSQEGMVQDALALYKAMQAEGVVRPNSVTFVCLLQACAIVGIPALEKGKQLHAQVREQRLEANAVVANSLVNMYAKCGSLEDAQGMFDRLAQKDVVTWNAMIAGYAQKGMGLEALSLLSAMQQEGMSAPNSVTFASLLQACASVGTPALQKGRQLHTQIRELGLQADVFVASSLVSMYAKCGSLRDARVVFDNLGRKDVVTWNAMIAGYSQEGMGQDTLCLYRTMKEEGLVPPNSLTFVCLLQACANLAALDLGRQLHAQIKDQGLEGHGLVPGSLINMYGKCGSMVDAQQVFQALHKRDVAVWNALIAGYTRQGDSKVVFGLFFRMMEDGILPDGVTFLSVLTACSHMGLVDKGREHFESMSSHYNITRTADHYTCMVDLLGRAGELDEALDVVRTMPLQPNAAIWHTLLGACQKWNNVEVGCHAFYEAVTLDKKDAAAYVLMSNIYTGAQMWEQALEMQSRRTSIKAWKQPGQSWWTDMDGRVHGFLVGAKA